MFLLFDLPPKYFEIEYLDERNHNSLSTTRILCRYTIDSSPISFITIDEPLSFCSLIYRIWLLGDILFRLGLTAVVNDFNVITSPRFPSGSPDNHTQSLCPRCSLHGRICEHRALIDGTEPFVNTRRRTKKCKCTKQLIVRIR